MVASEHARSLAASAGRLVVLLVGIFLLMMTGGEGNTLSVWGYSLNVWLGSELERGGEAQTLHMTTRYTFQWGSALSTLSSLFSRFWLVIIVSLLYIPLPGALLLKLWPDFLKEQFLLRLALIFGLGVSLWPLIWQWVTVVGLRFSPLSLQILLLVGWLIVLATSKFEFNFGKERLKSESLWMIVALAFVYCLRLLAIRDLAFLPWVDSSRHALITAIMRDSGQFLTTYEPYLPVSTTGYHYGFHTISAGVALILGERVSLPDLLLPLMQ